MQDSSIFKSLHRLQHLATIVREVTVSFILSLDLPLPYVLESTLRKDKINTDKKVLLTAETVKGYVLLQTLNDLNVFC